MIQTLIIDDEFAARASLQYFLENCCPDVEVIGTAISAEDGAEKILALQPQLVFLDIAMPPADGFSLLQMFPSRDFEVIFTTAYPQYALPAIKQSALDYLLKPISASDLAQAVMKAREKLRLRQAGKMKEDRVSFPTANGYTFLAPWEVIRAEVKEGRKTLLHLKKGASLLTQLTLGDAESSLEPHGFFRCHRLHIVNLREVQRYLPEKTGGFCVLTDGRTIPVSARKKTQFQEALKGVGKG